ncbi:cobalamin-binding protein [Thermoactinomyces daqus]|uniref:Cobalamin-binding protein n=1 Tax=Thermoactinomyces daqus TaxID=1329516 RepID=A0A7W2AGC5_9BACL|nr:cobalamin-binding protein [Thermoactinomyces daqus]MBA4542067.1 cobalamin-binding protein [Thermoactinomyces daqus]
MRIVSICPSNTELLYFLGVTDELAAVDNYSDWPPHWQDLPRVGPDLDIDIEKVKLFQPDLVIASLSVPGMEKNIERLKQERIPHIILNPKTLAGIAGDLKTLGEAIGRKKAGERAAERFLQEIEAIKQKIPHQEKPIRLYWEWWPKPVFTPGAKNWLTEISQLVGAVNVYGEVPQDSVQTDWDDVLKKDPDLALVVWTGIPIRRVKKNLICSRPGWQGHPLANEKNIYILEEGWYCRPSPRILTGIKHLAHILYPEHFPPQTGE